MIEHLVISGGANGGFSYLGAIKYLIENGILIMEDIQTIYATSIGTIITTVLCLQLDFENVEKYFLERPWKELYKMDVSSIFKAIQKGGLLDENIIKNTVSPLLLANDMSVDITMLDFYKKTKKEIHFFTTRFSDLSLIDISYKTHPTWKLTEAIYASCSLPILFEAFEKDNEQYIDGGILANYPLSCAIENNIDPETIFGITSKNDMNNVYNTSKYKILDYITSIVYKVVDKIRRNNDVACKLELQIYYTCSIYDIMKSIESYDERVRLFNLGIECAENYFNQRTDSKNSSNPDSVILAS
jgi:predicted acylesterase/phospholipase RssA